MTETTERERIRAHARYLFGRDYLDDAACDFLLQSPGFRQLCKLLASNFLKRGDGVTTWYLRTLPRTLLEHLLWEALGHDVGCGELPGLAQALDRAEIGREPEENLQVLADELAKKIVAAAERRFGVALWPVVIET